ncbi:minor capsid protein [Capybara microvirus Cap3_SP_414]|nr:minor capsid protein [Capybara microvirus Cap3_SP_414]
MWEIIAGLIGAALAVTNVVQQKKSNEKNIEYLQDTNYKNQQQQNAINMANREYANPSNQMALMREAGINPNSLNAQINTSYTAQPSYYEAPQITQAPQIDFNAITSMLETFSNLKSLNKDNKIKDVEFNKQALTYRIMKGTINEQVDNLKLENQLKDANLSKLQLENNISRAYSQIANNTIKNLEKQLDLDSKKIDYLLSNFDKQKELDDLIYKLSKSQVEYERKLTEYAGKDLEFLFKELDRRADDNIYKNAVAKMKAKLVSDPSELDWKDALAMIVTIFLDGNGVKIPITFNRK